VDEMLLEHSKEPVMSFPVLKLAIDEYPDVVDEEWSDIEK
jgi:hypothetical protein